MTGAVVGVLVGVVAVAAWLGGRWAAVLPRKSHRAAVLPRKSDEASITCAETDSKVIEGPSEAENFQEKVIATEVMVARVLVGARPDAGTTLRLDAPATGWKECVRRARDDGQWLDALGKTVLVGLRGSPHDIVELRAPGQMRLLIWDDHAELVVGSRALDTLGGIRGWAREWLTWATAWLVGVALDRERVLESADELGWYPTAVDLATDLASWGPLLDEHQDPDRWTQQTVPLPVPAGQGKLASLQLGEKCSNPLSVYGYDKTRWAERTGRGVAWLERMRQAGRRDGEPVWRWELRLRGDALQLRRRGDDQILVDFRKCATLADQAASARVWAHAFGNADSDKPTGHYRLTVAAERFDDRGRGLPLTRTRAVDPLWRLVQTAGGQAPVESLAQVRERKAAAREQWRREADDTALRGLAATVSLDHDNPETAAQAALEHARELLAGERWTDAFERQRAASHDLRDDEWSAPMSTQLCLAESTSDAPPHSESPPKWHRRPIDAVERWKARTLEHHPFAGVVRMMTADERERTRVSIAACGYDRDWPIVLYDGRILDGRNRDEIAFELWQQTGRDELIPSFVELVADDPERADEAALIYVQQRLSATRNLNEGERVAAAYKLFCLYRACRNRRAQLEPGRERFASRSVSAREAAEAVGVSPRSVERYAYVDQHAEKALGADRAKQLLAAIDRGEATVRAAEREVKRGLAKADAELAAEQLGVAGTDVSAQLPECVGEPVLEAPGVRLVKVDALELLRSLPDACIETVFLDGPYVLGSTGTTNKAGERVSVSPGDWDAQWTSPEHYLEAFLLPVAAQLERVLSPTGEVWASGTRHVLFALERALSSMPSFRLYQDICWQKTSPPPRLHPESGWTDDHELLLWYRARDERHSRRNVTDAKALLGSNNATWSITRPSAAEHRFGKHPTQKPERLLEVILAAHHGLVLDFCAGSCTTAVAAVRRGRPVICGDLRVDDGYLATGRLRVLDELAGEHQTHECSHSDEQR